MIETTTQSGLRERALAAYREGLARAEADRIEREREDHEQAVDRLNRMLRRLGIEATATDERVTIDGLTFGVIWEAPEYELVLWLTCPKCGQEAHSAPIYALPYLGQLIALPEIAPWCHRCPSVHEPAEQTKLESTLEERLLAALRLLVRDEIERAEAE